MQTSILFVEDNEDLRENAALVLGLEGYRVEVARDGREALDILEAGFSPNLIVSDIMMPRMDGYEFFEAVRQKKHLRGVPFIFLTARGSRHDVSVAKQLGADDYLVKPFDPEEFLIAIQSRLRRMAEMRAQVSESLDAARRTLVQLMSHELRTPLTYVTGGFALLAEELEAQPADPNNEDVRVSLELIQSGTQRLNRLAEQMVLYSEIISGAVEQRIETHGEYLELSYLVADALTVVQKLSQERDITFQRNNTDNETITVYGSHDLLITAISEVLRNAIQHSPAGERVVLGVSEQEGFAVFTIKDHGPGISEPDQDTIWDILVQSGRERNEQQGAGMGLPIVKGIITAHKGSIELHSKVGEGTEITLRLPLAAPPGR